MPLFVPFNSIQLALFVSLDPNECISNLSPPERHSHFNQFLLSHTLNSVHLMKLQTIQYMQIDWLQNYHWRDSIHLEIFSICVLNNSIITGWDINWRSAYAIKIKINEIQSEIGTHQRSNGNFHSMFINKTHSLQQKKLANMYTMRNLAYGICHQNRIRENFNWTRDIQYI